MSRLRQVGTFFKTDKGVFLVCLIIAITIWLFNELSKSYTVSQDIRVEYSVPNEEVIIRNKPTTVLITEVEASGWDLLNRALFKRAVTIIPSITTARDQQIGSATLRDLVKQRLGSGYTILDVYPSLISIQLDNQATKRIPVRANTNISAAPQHRLFQDGILKQDSITIIGSESVLESIEEWSTKPIEFNNITSSVSGSVELQESINTELRFRPNKVDFVIRVEQITEKEIRVPISIVTDFDSLLILPQEVRVIGNVSISDYETFSANDFEVQALINSSSDNPINRTAVVDLVQKPDGFENVRVIPSQIQYTVLDPQND